MKTEDEKYCVECGQVINVKAEICPLCGAKQPIFYANQPFQQSRSIQDDRWLPALLFCLFLGPFGGHRFYLGQIGTAVLQLVTLGGCGIWSLIDLIMIIVGKYKDKDGQYIKSPVNNN